MKVMFGTFAAASVLGGGVQVQVDSLREALTDLGVEVEPFDPWRTDYDLTRYDLFHLFGAHVGTYHFGRAMKTMGMRMVLTPVFYSRHPARKVAAMVAVARRLRKRGGFWTEHMFCKELCDMADLVLPNTSAEAQMIAGAFGVRDEKIGFLPNGVSERFHAATRDRFVEEYGLEDFLLYVGHVGWGRKNVLPFLRAAEQVGHPTVLIGALVDNEYGHRCETVIKRAGNITHVPALPSDSDLLASAYAACDTLVLPAFYETPGLAALEAGLAGAKVCITRHGGTSDYFGEHATYLEPRSEDSIREALIASLAKERDDVLREHIRTHFLWGEAGRQLLAAYEKLLAG